MRSRLLEWFRSGRGTKVEDRLDLLSCLLVGNMPLFEGQCGDMADKDQSVRSETG